MGKTRCRAAIKDESGVIVDEFFFSNNSDGIKNLIGTSRRYGPAKAVVESTGNMWMCIHDVLEENGIDTMLANPVKTKIIAQAKIKSDRLDARVLSDLLRGGLVYEAYVPSKEFREKRALVWHRVAFVRLRTSLKNKVQSLLDKYEYRSELSDIFGKSGMIWLKGLELTTIDRVIMDTSLVSIESLTQQIGIISKEIARYAWQSKDVKILLSLNGVDVFSSMVLSTEIVDVRRFATPWKLVSYAGIAPGQRESSGKTRRGRITKEGSRYLRWIIIQCARRSIIYDERLKRYYLRLRARKGDAKAIVVTAKEMLVIIWHMLQKQEIYNSVNKTLYDRKLSKIEMSPDSLHEVDE